MVVGNAVIKRQRSIQELSFACICNIIMMKCATRDNIWTAIESNYSVVHMISADCVGRSDEHFVHSTLRPLAST